MPLPFGSLVDPTRNQFDLDGRKSFATLRWRHLDRWVFRQDSDDDPATCRRAGFDGLVPRFQSFADYRLDVQAEVGLSLLAVGPVALVARLGKNRADVPVVIHLWLLGGVGETSGAKESRDHDSQKMAVEFPQVIRHVCLLRFDRNY